MAKKVANQLVETLIEAGVKRIYAVTGDSLNEVNEAVRQNEEMNGYMSAMKKQVLMQPVQKHN